MAQRELRPGAGDVMPRVVLNMIVKNEAHVIRRCLESVRPHVDAWCIVDTGSTDGTQDVIREALANLPGELHERPWVDFATNRNEALELARPLGDYVLVMDADDWLTVEPGFTFAGLTADVYTVVDILPGGQHQGTFPRIFRADAGWSWVGVIHGYPAPPPGWRQSIPVLAGATYHRSADGARHRDPKTDAETSLQTIGILLKAIDASGNDPIMARHYRWHLGREYMRAGRAGEAIATFRAIGERGDSQDNVYLATYYMAQLLAATRAEPMRIVFTFLRAFNIKPTRSEAPFWLAHYAYSVGLDALGDVFLGIAASNTPTLADSDFVEPRCYGPGVPQVLRELLAPIRDPVNGKRVAPARVFA